MTICCAPNPVNLAKLDGETENCYAWCELPAKPPVWSEFSSCLRMNDAFNQSTGGVSISGFQSSASTLVTGTGRVVTLAMAVTLLTHVLGGVL